MQCRPGTRTARGASLGGFLTLRLLMAQGQVCYKKFVIGAAAENPGHRNKSAPRLSAKPRQFQLSFKLAINNKITSS
jgi:hypothetical protein